MHIITFGKKNLTNYAFEEKPSKTFVIFDYDPYKGRSYRIKTIDGSMVREQGQGKNYYPIIACLTIEHATKISDKLNRRIDKLANLKEQ